MNIENYLAKPTKSVRKHTNELFEAMDILVKEKYILGNLLKLLKEAIEYHDYGKVNKYFQQRVKGLLKDFDDNIELPHNLLSLFFIPKSEYSESNYYKIAYAVLNHHQRFDPLKAFEQKRELVRENLAEFRGSMVNRVSTEEIKKITKFKTDLEAQLLKGFLHKCDYAASGEYTIEYPNDFLYDSLEDMKNQWKDGWNDLQKFTYKNKDKNIVVIANTGMGKTEAGLRWIDNSKGFFILPLRTAINAIYDRVANNIVKDNITERISLLHADAVSYYLKESVTEDEKILEYSAKGKAMSLPLTISTPDQLFNFVYKYNGFELKLATLSYSKIVIDEIQAYSPDLLAYIVTGLEKIVEAGGKFAILTATLPPFVMDYLTLDKKISEPNFKKFTEGVDRHYLEVREEEIDVDLIAEHYEENRGKTLVICNTVKKAQEVYDKLVEKGLERELNLIHAKFTKEHRKKKEDFILTFGDNDLKASGIWIATSIVEASLDIDFDYLFTELNDLNGLFQRLGRVNRKGIKDWMLDKPNAYLFTEIEKGLLRDKDKTTGFIDKKIYELSKNALLNYDDILSEKKKVELIEEYLTFDNIKVSDFNDRYHKTKKYIKDLYIGEKDLKEVQKKFRDIISYNVIPLSIYKKNKDEIEKNAEIIRASFEKDINLSENENNQKRNKLKLAKVKARDAIFTYVVSVGYYDNLSEKNEVDLKYEKLKVIECNYSFERGFERIKVKKEDEIFDAFL